MIYANVDRAGIVRFEPNAHEGGTLACGRHESAEILEAAASVVSRHSYDGKTYIAAGVRDAETDEEAEYAVINFRRRLRAAIEDAEAEAAEEAG